MLLVYPRFSQATFWNYTAACELVGARYPAAPLGLITLAAMLPANWDIRLVNRNTEDLTAPDLDWADLVMTGGMLAQQVDTLALIELGHRHGKPVRGWRADPTSSPEIYAAADFRVARRGRRLHRRFPHRLGGRATVRRCFAAPKFTIDVPQSPMPRFDLLKFEHYLYVGVQYSRGCPFTCEFCDIIRIACVYRLPRS